MTAGQADAEKKRRLERRRETSPGALTPEKDAALSTDAEKKRHLASASEKCRKQTPLGALTPQRNAAKIRRMEH